MRKLQALHLLATPGVRTTTDVVVSIVQDLTRALLQAPAMRLQRAAEHTDWDAALAGLADADRPPGGPAHEDAAGVAPVAPDAADPEAERFALLHAALHDAVRAVVEATEGEISYLE